MSLDEFQGVKLYPIKRYWGHLCQYSPEYNLWTLDWILHQMAMDSLLKWLDGWSIIQPIGDLVGPNRARWFVAQKVYCAGASTQSVQMTLAAIDFGMKFDAAGRRFHLTHVDANFLDSQESWTIPASEQIVVEALQILSETYGAASAGPSASFWYRDPSRIGWVCGKTLYPCPEKG